MEKTKQGKDEVGKERSAEEKEALRKEAERSLLRLFGPGARNRRSYRRVAERLFR